MQSLLALLELLKQEKLHVEVFHILRKRREQYSEENEGQPFKDAHLSEQIAYEEAVFYGNRMAQAFDKHVISRLDKPLIVSTLDLTECAFHQFAGRPQLDSDAVVRFLSHVSVRPRWREETLCEVGRWCDDRNSSAQWEPPQIPLHKDSADDNTADPMLVFDVKSLDGVLNEACSVLNDRESYVDVNVSAMLWGEFSDDARRIAKQECSFFMPSLIRSITLLAKNLEGIDTIIRTDWYGRIPHVSFLQSQLVGDLCRCWFSSYYFTKRKAKKDSIDDTNQRLQNAVKLLICADQQESPAISLSLSFGAIEALVCWSRTGITDELKRNVAALLEPNSAKRQDAQKKVADFYGKRSNALHGVAVETSQNDVDYVRGLAAAVFCAINQWKLFQARMDDSTKRKTLKKHLEEARESGCAMICVSEEMKLQHCLL